MQHAICRELQRLMQHFAALGLGCGSGMNTGTRFREVAGITIFDPQIPFHLLSEVARILPASGHISASVHTLISANPPWLMFAVWSEYTSRPYSISGMEFAQVSAFPTLHFRSHIFFKGCSCPYWSLNDAFESNSA